MTRLYKGQVSNAIGGTWTVCGGDYWDWPWWKRVLSTLGERPYRWWYVIRGTLFYCQRKNRDRYPSMVIGGFQFHVDTCRSLASSRIKPIWFELHGPPFQSSLSEEE